MGKKLLLYCLTALVWTGGIRTEAAEGHLWQYTQEKEEMPEKAGGEILRKRLGEERYLVFYVEETGRRRVRMNDGGGLPLTKTLTKRIEKTAEEHWEALVEMGNR